MGGRLRTAYGADYVALGLSFGRGSFNAVQQTGSVLGSLGVATTSLVPPQSIEALFDATGKTRALFDARQIPSGGAASSPLAESITMRSIGSAYDPSQEALYFRQRRLPSQFDLLVYIGTAG